MQEEVKRCETLAFKVIAGLVAAGLDGLQRALELPPERQTQDMRLLEPFKAFFRPYATCLNAFCHLFS